MSVDLHTIERLDREARFLIKEVTRCLPSHLEDVNFSSFLHIGCSTGRWVLGIAERYPSAQVTGIDISPGRIECAKAYAQIEEAKNVSFLVQDIFGNDLPF